MWQINVFQMATPVRNPLSLRQNNEVAWVIVLVQFTPWFNNRRESASVLVKDLEYFIILQCTRINYEALQKI